MKSRGGSDEVDAAIGKCGGFCTAIHAVKAKSIRQYSLRGEPHFWVWLHNRNCAAKIQKQNREQTRAEPTSAIRACVARQHSRAKRSVMPRG